MTHPGRIPIDDLASAMRERVAPSIKEHEVAGAAVGLIAAGDARSFGVGTTSVLNPLDVTAETMFQIASISKIFTATTAVRLAERGVLSLTEPMRSYLPDLRLADENCARALTLEDLLSHRSGWPGEFDADPSRGDDALARLAEVWEAAPQWVPVGREFSYSNLGYGLAGHVIATVAGKPFEKVVDEEVIEPLGLKRTSFFLEEVAFERWAAGHRRVDDRIEHAPWWRPRARGPNGGLLSCVEDMLVFARFHLGDGLAPDGNRLLSPGALSDMRRARAFDTIDTSVGLGWMLQRWDGVDAASHYGGTYGFATALVLFPAESFAVVLLTNAAHGGEVVDSGLREFLNIAFGVTVAGHVDCGLAPEERAEIVGVYEGQGGLVEVVIDDDGTMKGRVFRNLEELRSSAEPLRTTGLVPVAKDALGVDGGSLASRYATVVRDESGGVAFLRVGRRLFKRIAES